MKWNYLAVVAAVFLPLGAALGWSWYQTRRQVEDDLWQLARATSARTVHILDLARRELRQVADTTQGRCDEQTVQALQRVIFDVSYFREAGLILGGQLRCTNFGIVTPPTPVTNPEHRRVSPTPGGIAIVGPVRSDHHSKSVLVNYGIGPRGYYNVLIDPEVFSEFQKFFNLGDRSGIFLIHEDGTPLASFGPMTIEELPPLDGSPAEVWSHADKLLVATRAGPYPVLVVVAASGLYQRMYWRRSLALSLWLGALTSSALVVMTARLRRLARSLEAQLRRAFRRGWLRVHYQPVIDLATGRCVGAEVLMRWPHPERGFIPPTVFIPLAEQSGLIVPMTEWLLERVKAEMGEFLRARPGLHLAVNLSAAHFADEQILLCARRVFRDGLRPEQIIYEITERGMLEGNDAPPGAEESPAVRVMVGLRQDGSRLAVDDFGTGYSNLHCLQRYTVDFLKIDRAFVQGIVGGEDSAGLLDHVIAIAVSLRLRMIAEGVETGEQAAYLRARGVELAQGWFYARALPAEEFRQFVEKNEAARG